MGCGDSIADVLDPFGTLHEGAPGSKVNPLAKATTKPPKLKKPTLVEDADALVALQKKKAKQDALAAYGTSDTILTGGKGLGSVGSSNKDYATLLGT